MRAVYRCVCVRLDNSSRGVLAGEAVWHAPCILLYLVLVVGPLTVYSAGRMSAVREELKQRLEQRGGPYFQQL